MTRVKLYDILVNTHIEATKRRNASTQVFNATLEMNGEDLIKSITAALMCFGGIHAPIKQTYDMLMSINSSNYSINLIKNHKINGKIPGFGSAFVKGEPDPMLDDISKACLEFEKLNTRVDFSIDSTISLLKTYLLHTKKKNFFPNLAFWHAVTCILLNLTDKEAVAPLIQGRVIGLLSQYNQYSL